MDDPWGSPWATDEGQLKLDLPAPPPQVHTPQTPQRTPSPWGHGDDDAWGGWNAADGAGGANSPGWGRSPGLRPTRSGTISRQVSPEPWGRLDRLDSSFDTSGEKKSLDTASATIDSAISLGEQPFAEVSQVEEAVIASKEVQPVPLADVSNELDMGPSMTDGDAQEVGSEVSQRPDSPVAEPTRASTVHDRPEPMRQASKVQELVHMYDGIATRKDPPGETLTAGPRITLVDADGIVDDAEAPGHGATDDKAQVPWTNPTRLSATGTKDLQSSSTESSSSPAGEEGEEESTADAGAPSPERTIFTYAKAPSIPYAFDLTHLDDLFPSTPTPSINPEPVPDVIIDDTFASISERKAWYRLSRSGPMRQHNLGNDEDYVRLNWHASETRTRTLQIVRRWMEEDSIAGRAGLGRRSGAIGGSMFNWDSQAPPVEIGDLFGKKSHGRSVSGASKGSLGSLPSPSSATFAWSNDSHAPERAGKPSLDAPERDSWIAPPSSIRSPAVANFSWSSEPPGSAAPDIIQQRKRSGLPSRMSPSPIIAPPAQHAQSIESMIAKPKGAPTGRQAVPESDDDDDWGEMVSSPTLPSEPIDQAAAPTARTTDPMIKVDDPPTTRHPVQGPGFDIYTIPPIIPSTLPAHNEPLQDARSRSSGEISSPAPAEPVIMAVKTSTVESPASLWLTEDVATSTGPSNPEVSDPVSFGLDSTPTSDEETTIRRIIGSLPDLSYMLR